jgi:hypothetical protein
MKHLYSTIILIFILFLSYNAELRATHAMGADLTYSCLGNNRYNVRLQFYRDCNGINAAVTETVQVSAPGCTSIPLSLNLINVTETTPSCPGIVGTACNNGGGQFGIQRFVYEGVITLPTTCSDWTITWSLCCRNVAITTLINPGSNSITLRTRLNTNICNNSPVFLNNPTPFVCNNQPVFYNHGATDSDGDDLRYSLTPCYNSTTNIVSYSAGFSSTNPINTTSGLQIDSTTGAISFTPNGLQVGVICVLVEEYRNGIKIGEVVRDIQVTVVNCSNMMPELSGINGSNIFSDTFFIGQQTCFNVFSSDSDSGQLISLEYNNAITNATFSSVGTPYPTGIFCWSPTLADTGWNNFTIRVFDDYCPIVGQNTYTFSIYVPTPIVNPACLGLNVDIQSVGNLLCNNNDGSAIITASGGVQPYNYSLIDFAGNVIFSNSTGVFDNLSIGTYTVYVYDANGCSSNCINQELTVNGNSSPLSIDVISSNIRCASNPTGSITINVNGGTAPYQYSIGNGFVSSNTFNSVTAGSYQVVVMDANGCSAFDTVVLTVPNPISINFTNIRQPTCGRLNGQFTITASFGTAPYTYSLNGANLSSNTVSALGNGIYIIVATDANGCVGSNTITLNGNTYTLTETIVNTTCYRDCDGSIVLNSTNPVNYIWSNGSSASSLNNLCAGTYNVTVNNSSGCRQIKRYRITQPANLNVQLSSSTNESCARNNGTITLRATGGTAPYSYTLTNTSTGASFVNNTGIFSGLSAAVYRFTATDSRGCSPSAIRQVRIRYQCTNLIQENNPQELLARHSISANPNPAKNLTEISYFSESEAELQISLLDINSRTLKTFKNLVSEGVLSLEVNNLQPATYILVLQDKNGKILSSTRLVIVR